MQVVKIEVDNTLMETALQLSQLRSKKEVVDEALRQMVARLRRQQMLQLRGQVQWDGNLDEMRAA